jgi:hypothetical protein
VENLIRKTSSGRTEVLRLLVGKGLLIPEWAARDNSLVIDWFLTTAGDGPILNP